jgi:uncharacterized metal-binding protein
LIFSCSGSADVGELSDKAARLLTRQGAGNMFCLAGIGGKVSGILKSTEAASGILVIDGCKLDCARLCLSEAGITKITHVRITDHGCRKGRTAVTEENIARIVNICLERNNHSNDKPNSN